MQADNTVDLGKARQGWCRTYHESQNQSPDLLPDLW